MPFDDFDRSRQRGLDDHLRRLQRSSDDSERRRKSWDRQNTWEGMGAVEIFLSVVGVIILLIIMASHR
ncbi:hypothetical protein [Nonomuraea sp. NPDC049141]|uniref:hypothetical protein n=1 Tax=Nonomuraea sp. NPDC049141 TaxID=3155500 RepID=UPI0033EF1283